MQMGATCNCDGDGDGKLKGKNKDGEVAASLASAHPREKLSLSSPSCGKKKLLILDINGLLAHTFFHDQGVKIPASRLPDVVMGLKYVFKRPFCDDFLRFCFDNFEIAIWSSATRRNVVGAVECVMGAFADRLLFIWDQGQCTDTGFKTLEKKDKPLFVKQLSKVWDEDAIHNSLPQWHRGRFSPTNTLLVDDSPYKALLNP
ncbi:hypothetical protein Taro_009333, partial [Colocasia esculenta]|nr:hypothetical protein [Colocasia esculenta]